MKAWEKQYKSEDLDEAIKLAENVSIISNDGVEIIAQVEDYRVKTYIQFQSPTYPSCSCPSGYPCRHEAALTYYLKNHPELYIENQSFEDLFTLLRFEDLKDFLTSEFEHDNDLKDRFLKRFSNNSIDKNHYSNKLDTIFRRGQGRDFEYHGFYDLDSMEMDLYDFLSVDIINLLNAREHDFAYDLLIMIAKLLNDEVISTSDSWYDLADSFMEQVNALSFSIYLDSDKLDELNSNIGHILDRL